MIRFDSLYQAAVSKAGSEGELLAKLPEVKSTKELQELPDDRYLAAMTKCIFRAGFVWRVIEHKWPGFELAFNNFNPMGNAHCSDERLEELAQDTRIVRNMQKIKTVRENAMMILDKKRTHGSFANWIAEWPSEDTVGLWSELKKSGARLGGNTSAMFLRTVGKDTFIITGDVQAALTNYGFMDKISPNSKRDREAIQAIFNDLQQQSGRPLAEISRILAHTV
jgi:3-methyladenine DNA glycosylase Tag